jgi:hypothetical protein
LHLVLAILAVLAVFAVGTTGYMFIEAENEPMARHRSTRIPTK